MTDILERLKATTKINGAYPRDIEDAIKEIIWLREQIDNIYNYVEDTRKEVYQCS